MTASPKSWWPAVLMSAVLWASVPFARTFSEGLRSRGWLSEFVLVLSAGGLILAAIGTRHRWSRWPPWRWMALTAILAAYAALMTFAVVAPEERIHFLQITLLAYLFYRPRPTPHIAGGLAALVGILEEFMQIFVPARFFDWRDVGMNVVAGALSAALLYIL